MPANRAEGDVDEIVARRFFPKTSHGLFVEVGAARPDYISVSNLFRRRGWKVLAIEPNPAYAEHYARLGYELLPYAVDDRDEDNVDFTVVDMHGRAYKNGAVTNESFSSLAIKPSYNDLSRHLDKSTIKVNVRRLDTIMAQEVPLATQIDVISIDIEGWELEALGSLDFERYRPQVLIVENLFFEARYRQFMADRGYVLWRCLAPNDVYVRDTLLSSADRMVARLLTAPVTALGRLRRRLAKIKRSVMGQ